MTRLLGIDHGDARIGIAISDRALLTARELTIIERKSKREDFAQINVIANEQDITGLIIGLPSDFDTPEGVEYTQADRVRTWVERLKETTTLPILFWDEQLTTVDAHALAKRLKRPARARVDDLAARVMLQSYLDALRDGLAQMPDGQT